MGLCVLVLGLWLGPTTPAWGQEEKGEAQYVRTQWTAEDGLPVNAVNDIVQTDDGYLWLATFDGLVRFDGKNFRVYRSGQHEGLPSNRILTLLVRPDGLWLRTESWHVVRFRNGTFTTVAENAHLLTEDAEGRLWAGAEKGVMIYREGRFQPVAPNDIRAEATALLMGTDGTLWVGADEQGLYRRTPEGRVQHLTTDDGLHGQYVWSLTEDRDGRVWIGVAGGGVHRWQDGELVDVPVEGLPTDSLDVFSVDPDVRGTCLVAARQGIFRCEDDRLVPAIQEPVTGPTFAKGVAQVGPDEKIWVNAETTVYRGEVPVVETEGSIRRIFFDREGNVWIGTNGSGLIRLHPSPFMIYGEPEGLVGSNIYPIEQRRDGSVWLGTLGGGVSRIGTSGEVSTYFPKKYGHELANVWALEEDRSGRLWMSGAAGRLCRFEDGRCARPDAESPIRARIRAFYEDRRGRLWAGSEGKGLFRCDSNCLTPSPWTQFTPENSSLNNSYVRTIHEAPGGAIWVGTNGGGIARLANGTFQSFTTQDGLSSNSVRDIYQDTTEAGSPEVLWVVTEDQGLNRIELNSSGTLSAASVTVYRTTDGLYDNALHQMLKDDQGRFWLSSNRGLFWVRKTQLETFARGEIDRIRSVSYTTKDGLRSREANGGVQPAGLKAQDGRLWFPTQKGAAVVDPSTIPEKIASPPVHVETVTSEDSILSRHQDGPIGLAADQRNFEISYTGINLSSPESVQFRYRLAGLQKDWQMVEARRQAIFTAVPPGRYTFEVEARVLGGDWSDEPVRVPLTVAPYFYETWWFYGLCLLALGLIGVGLVQYRFYALRRREKELNRKVETRTRELAEAKKEAERAKENTEDFLATVEAQAEQLKKLDEMKSRFFANISHELRTPLSLMIGPVQQMLGEERPDEEQEILRIVHRNAERLHRLVEQLLDLARYDAGHLSRDASREEWATFVKRVTQRFVPMAEAQDVFLSVSTEEADQSVVFDPDHMETVLANLVRNALTYTPSGGTVSVEASVEEDTVFFVVEDTGPGIPEEEQEKLFDRFYRGAGQARRGGAGIGLALTKALVALHEGTIEVESTPGEGTRFNVTFPIMLKGDEGEGSSSLEAEMERDGPASPALGQGMNGKTAVRGDGGEHAAVESVPSEGATPLVDRTTVLVMEDNADLRRYVRGLLEPRYRVIESDNGQDGLERARRELPDLVVADVMMPEMDGLSMLKALRESDRTKCIPVVMLTARAEASDQVEGLEEGADVYMTKPFNPDVLTVQIEGLIATRRQLREQFDGSESGGATGEMEEGAKEPESFEDRVRKTVQAHLSDPDFSVGDLAEEVGLSRGYISEKVKEELGRPPSELIRSMRLERGAELLNEGAGTISEVAYAVGFNSLSYFSRRFKEYFGVSPSAYQNEDA